MIAQPEEPTIEKMDSKPMQATSTVPKKESNPEFMRLGREGNFAWIRKSEVKRIELHEGRKLIVHDSSVGGSTFIVDSIADVSRILEQEFGIIYSEPGINAKKQ